MNTQTKVKKESKNINVFIIQGFYGTGIGWEYESSSVDYKKARRELKDYQNNSKYPSRLITRRVSRENYILGNF